MCLLSENIIPGNHGKTFGTNAKKGREVEVLADAISKIDGYPAHQPHLLS